MDDQKVPFNLQFQAQTKFFRHIVPLLHGHSLDSLSPEGSSIYLIRDGRLFLVTAHHVIKNVDLGKVLVLREHGKASSLPAKRIVTTTADFLDIAVIELSEPIEEFEPMDYVKVQNIENKESVFHLTGFPVSKVSRVDRNHMMFSQYFVLSRPTEDGKTLFADFDERADTTFAFRKKNVLLGNGKVATFPDPIGMSGGGAFELFFSDAGEFQGYHLVGIMTEWKASRGQCIRCTKSDVVTTMIEKAFFS